jgi:SAM-dependent methyltransferase
LIEEKIKWNEKHRFLTPKPPSKLLEFVPSKKGKALDLGGGYGRNAKVLCDKGYEVTLIDISEVGISKIKDSRIKTLCLDLDEYELKKNSYDAILMIKYFNYELLKQIPEALKAEGYFIFETINKYPVEKKDFFNIFKNFEILYFTQTPFRFVGKKIKFQ